KRRGIEHEARRNPVDVDDLPAAPPFQEGCGDPRLLLQPRIADLHRTFAAHRVEFPEHAVPAPAWQVIEVVESDVDQPTRHVMPQSPTRSLARKAREYDGVSSSHRNPAI